VQRNQIYLYPKSEAISGAGTFFEREGTENVIYKFCFAKKSPIICINQ